MKETSSYIRGELERERIYIWNHREGTTCMPYLIFTITIHKRIEKENTSNHISHGL